MRPLRAAAVAAAAAPRPDPGPLAGTRLAASPALSDAERRLLDAAASPARPVGAGAALLREGEAADRLHILLDGWAVRYKTTRDGMRQIVALLLPGDVANLDTLLFARPGYGVRVLAPARVASIPRERALALAAGHPGVAHCFALLALAENAVLAQWATCLGRKSARQRLAHLLCELGARLGGEGGFDLPLTQEQLADALGLTPVHVNRTLQRLRADGLIATAGRAVSVPDAGRLRDAADFDPAYLRPPEPPAAPATPIRSSPAASKCSRRPPGSRPGPR